MGRFGKLLGLLALSTLAVGCDQALDRTVERDLADRPPVSLLGGTVRFELAANPGAFLGLGGRLPAGARAAATALVAGMLAVVGFLAISPPGSGLRLGPTLVFLGGGMNLVDRLVRSGRVLDYVSMGLGPLRTGIFNLADVTILTGLAVWVVRGWLLSRPDHNPSSVAPG